MQLHAELLDVVVQQRQQLERPIEAKPLHERRCDLPLSGSRARRTARGHPDPHSGGAAEGRLRAECLRGARPPTARVPRVLRLSRRADAARLGAHQGRARDDRRRDGRRQRVPLLLRRPRRHPARLREEPARRRPGRRQLPEGRHHAAPAGDARLRAQGVAEASSAIGDDDFAALSRARLRRRGRLGHRQHRGVLLPVEPDGELHRPAARTTNSICWDGRRRAADRCRPSRSPADGGRMPRPTFPRRRTVSLRGRRARPPALRAPCRALRGR